eukprot:COSAG03_NODE_17829_length_367_cov_0.723881_1_plen_68_part_10
MADLALFLDAMVNFESAQQEGWEFPAPFNLPAGCSCYRSPALSLSLSLSLSLCVCVCGGGGGGGGGGG